MKRKIAITTTLLVVVTVSLYQCTRCSNTTFWGLTTSAVDSTLIESVLASKLDSIESQYYHLDKIDENKYIIGEGGTILCIRKNAFLYNGNYINENIKVELKEVQTLDDFVKYRISTQSNDRLLSTEGSYYINATHDGEQLQLNLDVGLNVSFPAIEKNDSIKLFTGELTNEGDINWIETDNEEEPLPKPTIKAPKYVGVDTYEERSVKRLLDEIDKYYHIEGDEYVYGNTTWGVGYINKARRWYEYHKASIEAEAEYNKLFAKAWVNYLNNPQMKKYLERGNKKRAQMSSYEYALASFGWFNCDRLRTESIVSYTGNISDENGARQHWAKVHLISWTEMIHLQTLPNEKGDYSFDFEEGIPFEIYVTQKEKETSETFDGKSADLGEIILK